MQMKINIKQKIAWGLLLVSFPLLPREKKAHVAISNYEFNILDKTKVIEVCFANDTNTDLFSIRGELGYIYKVKNSEEEIFCDFNHYFLEQHGGRINPETAVKFFAKKTTCFNYDIENYCDFKQKGNYKLKLEIVYFEYSKEIETIQSIRDAKKYYEKLIATMTKADKYNILSNSFNIRIK